MATYTFRQRLVGAAKLDARIYEDIEADVSAWRQAFAVVFLASVAAGAGAFPDLGPAGFVSQLIAGILGWVLWAWLTYCLGTTVFPTPRTQADFGQLLRTTGFAMAPGILAVLGVVRPLTGVVFFVTAVWTLIAFVVAVRQALDYQSTLRAVAVCFVGWLIYAFVLIALAWPAF